MPAAKPAKPPSEEEISSLPEEDRLKQAALASQRALEAQGAAQKLKDAASSIADPKKREKFLRDAYDKEIEAHGNSKKARMFSSGTFQGGVGGAGIGGAVGAGVGTLVGTVVGTVTAIPTTAVGGIVGMGTGVFHGPFIKLPPIGGGDGKEKKDGKGGKGGKGKKTDGKDKEKQKGKKEAEDDEEGVVPDPEALRQAADAVAEERAKQEKEGSQAQKTERKKPRKIEIRNRKSQENA